MSARVRLRDSDRLNQLANAKTFFDRQEAARKARLSKPKPWDPLTEREIEVLRLMVAGYSNREIADAVRVSGTVKNHVSSILSKLGVRDRTRAVLKASNSDSSEILKSLTQFECH